MAQLVFINEKKQKNKSSVLYRDMERVMYPAVLGCPVFRRCVISIWRFGWRQTGFSVIFLVFVEIAVLHPVRPIGTGHSGEVLAAALVLLDGLVKGPELTEQGHVLLPQAHLRKHTHWSEYLQRSRGQQIA